MATTKLKASELGLDDMRRDVMFNDVNGKVVGNLVLVMEDDNYVNLHLGVQGGTRSFMVRPATLVEVDRATPKSVLHFAN